jgi:hypothetical protein
MVSDESLPKNSPARCINDKNKNGKKGKSFYLTRVSELKII